MSCDIQPYLESICADYKHWQEYYVPTNAEGKLRLAEKALPTIDFMMVQTVPKGDGRSEETERRDQEKIERLPVLEGIRKYADRHVLLVGRPGSGKSTALARLMLEEATTLQQTSEVSKTSEVLPVLVELRYWQGSIDQLILKVLARHGLPLTVEQLEAVLARSLLLFDGVNELPSEEARSQLIAFRRDHPKLPMIFTTRDLSLGGDLGIEQKLEMQPLTEAQMQAFVRAYVPEQAEALLRQLKDRLRELGQTPLLLWMLCQLFQQTGTIPENLGLVFRLFTQGYEQGLKQDVVIESDRAWWQPVLQQLAWVMMQGEQPTELRVAIAKKEAVGAIAQFLNGKVPYAEDFARKCLRDLQKHHLIQAGAGHNELEFRHQLLQEYYAAEALLERLPNLSDVQLKRHYLNYLKWTEPVALMLALVDSEAQALRVVQLALAVDLRLGARLAGEVKSAFQARTIGLLHQKKIQKPVNLFQIQLGSYPVKMPFWLRVQLLAQSHSEFAIPGLLNALEHSDWNVRESAAEALANIGSEAAISGLLNALEHSNSDVRRCAVEALGNIGSEAAIPGLLNALEHSDWNVRRSAADALGKIGSNAAIQGLLNALQSEDSWVRSSAARALGQLGADVAIPRLLELLQDGDSRVRSSAAEALGELRSHIAVSALLHALQDLDIGWSTVDALGKIGSDVAIPELLKVLKTENSCIRWRAAVALGKLGVDAAISELVCALRAEDPDVRWRAADGLGELAANIATPKLLQVFLEDEDFHVRWSAGHALCKLGTHTVVPQLVQGLESKTSDVRWKSAIALGELGVDAAIPELLRGLNSEDSNIYQSAARGLGIIGNNVSISALLDALKSENRSLRLSATIALGRLESADTIPALLTLMKDSNSDVYWHAADALDNMAKKHTDKLAPHLPHLFTLIPTDAGQDAHRVILAIQANCKYYNYAIQNEKLEIQNAAQGLLSSQSTQPQSTQSSPAPGTTINAEIVQIIENNHGTVTGKSP